MDGAPLRVVRTHVGPGKNGRQRVYLEIPVEEAGPWRYQRPYEVIRVSRRHHILRLADGPAAVEGTDRRVFRVSRRFRDNRELAVIEHLNQVFTPDAVVIVKVHPDQIDIIETQETVVRQGRRKWVHVEPKRVIVLRGFDDEAHVQRVAQDLRRKLLASKQFTVGDTFCGCGGTHLGFREAGFRTVYAVDWSEVATRLYRLNFPGIPVYTMDIRDFMPAHDVDVLISTPPCDDFSTLGERKGLDGEQSSLLNEIFRLIDHRPPRYAAFVENVSPVMTAKGGRVREYIREQFARRGFTHYYDVVLPALGWVPQLRTRYYGVALNVDVPFTLPAPNPARAPLGAIMEPDEAVPASYNWTEKMAQYLRQLRPGRHSLPIIGKPDSWYAATATENGPKGNDGSLIYERPDGTLRKFTEVEALRYMGYPDSYNTGGLSLSRLSSLLGNSVVPPVIKAFAQRIWQALIDGEVRRLAARLAERPSLQLAFNF